MLKHVSVIRPTMFWTSLDIKTAFDGARPSHVAKIMENHDTHGWLIAALLREVSGLEGKVMFECVESSFAFNRCLRQGSVEAPRLRQQMATQLLANVEEEWVTKEWESSWTLNVKRHIRKSSFKWADNFWIMSHSKRSGGA